MTAQPVSPHAGQAVMRLLDRLDGTRQRGSGWISLCPAHADRSPSLSVRQGEVGALVRCFAGCSIEAICSSIGLTLADLFDVPRRRQAELKTASVEPGDDFLAQVFGYSTAHRMRQEGDRRFGDDLPRIVQLNRWIREVAMLLEDAADSNDPSRLRAVSLLVAADAYRLLASEVPQ